MKIRRPFTWADCEYALRDLQTNAEISSRATIRFAEALQKLASPPTTRHTRVVRVLREREFPRAIVETYCRTFNADRHTTILTIARCYDCGWTLKLRLNEDGSMTPVRAMIQGRACLLFALALLIASIRALTQVSP